MRRSSFSSWKNVSCGVRNNLQWPEDEYDELAHERASRDRQRSILRAAAKSAAPAGSGARHQQEQLAALLALPTPTAASARCRRRASSIPPPPKNRWQSETQAQFGYKGVGVAAPPPTPRRPLPTFDDPTVMESPHPGLQLASAPPIEEAFARGIEKEVGGGDANASATPLNSGSSNNDRISPTALGGAKLSKSQRERPGKSAAIASGGKENQSKQNHVKRDRPASRHRSQPPGRAVKSGLTPLGARAAKVTRTTKDLAHLSVDTRDEEPKESAVKYVAVGAPPRPPSVGQVRRKMRRLRRQASIGAVRSKVAVKGRAAGASQTDASVQTEVEGPAEQGPDDETSRGIDEAAIQGEHQEFTFLRRHNVHDEPRRQHEPQEANFLRRHSVCDGPPRPLQPLAPPFAVSPPSPSHELEGPVRKAAALPRETGVPTEEAAPTPRMAGLPSEKVAPTHVLGLRSEEATKPASIRPCGTRMASPQVLSRMSSMFTFYPDGLEASAENKALAPAAEASPTFQNQESIGGSQIYTQSIDKVPAPASEVAQDPDTSQMDAKHACDTDSQTKDHPHPKSDDRISKPGDHLGSNEDNISPAKANTGALSPQSFGDTAILDSALDDQGNANLPDTETTLAETLEPIARATPKTSDVASQRSEASNAGPKAQPVTSNTVDPKANNSKAKVKAPTTRTRPKANNSKAKVKAAAAPSHPKANYSQAKSAPLRPKSAKSQAAKLAPLRPKSAKSQAAKSAPSLPKSAMSQVAKSAPSLPKSVKSQAAKSAPSLPKSAMPQATKSAPSLPNSAIPKRRQSRIGPPHLRTSVRAKRKTPPRPMSSRVATAPAATDAPVTTDATAVTDAPAATDAAKKKKTRVKRPHSARILRPGRDAQDRGIVSQKSPVKGATKIRRKPLKQLGQKWPFMVRLTNNVAPSQPVIVRHGDEIGFKSNGVKFNGFKSNGVEAGRPGTSRISKRASRTRVSALPIKVAIADKASKAGASKSPKPAKRGPRVARPMSATAASRSKARAALKVPTSTRARRSKAYDDSLRYGRDARFFAAQSENKKDEVMVRA